MQYFSHVCKSRSEPSHMGSEEALGPQNELPCSSGASAAVSYTSSPTVPLEHTVY